MIERGAHPLQPSRRLVLKAVAAAGGSFILGFPLRAGAQTGAPSMLSAFICIDPAERVTLVLPYVEMGQGAYTSQVQILAEELEVDPQAVAIEAAPAEPRYASPLLGEQITGGSLSLRGAWASMRPAAAAAREMLVEAAALRWAVPASDCAAALGMVTHAASGRTLSYGELAQAAALLPVPSSPVLKSKADFKVVGSTLKRLDTPDKITGRARFGIDARPQGVRYAMVQACPVCGGTLADVDAADALKIRGVQQVVRIENAVAVVATDTWAARKGLAALRITWSEGANAAVSTEDFMTEADAALDRAGLIATDQGDVDAAERTAAVVYDEVFRLPMLAHAAMEPLSCTVHVRRDGAELWLGSQILGRAHAVAASASGLPPESVVLHNHYLGGGFGRRLEVDYVEQAVLIAKQIEGPVKVTWSREEDMRQDYYRFHNHSRVKVGLNANGRPVSWRHKLVGPAVMARWLPAFTDAGVDLDIVSVAYGPYEVPNVQVEFVPNEAPQGLATGNWRGVGATRNVVIVESVIDDLAARAGEDPIAYRKGLITEPRILAVLEAAETASDWNTPLPPRSGRGVATFSDFGSHLAVVAQVRVDAAGEVHVERVTCAVDTGIAVNPDIVRAQIEGGVIFGLSAVLWGKVTVVNGRVVEGNFNDYRVMRMHEAPAIEVIVIDSDAEPGGVGEPGTSGAIAAVANAVFAATGKRFYTLPIDPADLRENA